MAKPGGLTRNFQNYLFSRGIEPVEVPRKASSSSSKKVVYGKKAFFSANEGGVPPGQVSRRGVLRYYSKGKAILGMKLSIGATWRECSILVTKDGALHCHDHEIDFTATFDLNDCRVLAADQETNKPHSFCVVDFTSKTQLYFQAADFDEYASWISTMTLSDSDSEAEAEAEEGTRASNKDADEPFLPALEPETSPLSPGFKSSKSERRTIKLVPVSSSFTDQKEMAQRKKAASLIAAHFRGYRQRKSYLAMRRAVVKLQSLARLYLFRKTNPDILLELGLCRLLRRRRNRSAILIQRWFRANRKVDENQIRKSLPEFMRDHEYRTSVVKEILVTEESYVKDLDTTVRVFLHPLRALFCQPIYLKREAGASAESTHERERFKIIEDPSSELRGYDPRAEREKRFIVTEQHLHLMFCNIEEILDRHRALLTSLRKAVEDWSVTQTIGNIFTELGDSPLIAEYIKYCNNFDHAIRTLDECKEKNTRFNAFLETAGGLKRVKKYQLAAFLTLPVQRLPRYILLLKDLVKHTHPDHPDGMGLRAGLNKIQSAVAQIDRAKTKNETRKQRGRYKKKFLEPAEVSTIFSSDSAFCILEGPAQITIKKPEDEPMKLKAFLLLFADQLVIVRRVTDRSLELSGIGKKGKNLYHKTYRFSDAITVPIVELESNAKTAPASIGFGFEFQSSKGLYTFQVKTFDDQSNWIREINKARKAVELKGALPLDERT